MVDDEEEPEEVEDGTGEQDEEDDEEEDGDGEDDVADEPEATTGKSGPAASAKKAKGGIVPKEAELEEVEEGE